LNNRILIISDLHCPFEHIDALPFLIEVKNNFNPDKIIFLGDEIDGNAISFHEKDPDALFTPAQEMEAAINHLHPFMEMFPIATILESNHGSLVYRRQKFAGLPRSVMKSYHEILGAPSTWEWKKEHEEILRDGSIAHFMHGTGSSNAFGVASKIGKHHIIGHYHTKFQIRQEYVAGKLLFGMVCGCLIDHHKYAFDYAKTFKPNPKLGCAMIVDNFPILIPMKTDENNRWAGSL